MPVLPPVRGVHGQRTRKPRAHEPRHGVRPRRARERRTVAVAQRDGDLIHARRQRHKLLIDHTLIGPHRLAEMTHPDLFVAGDLAHGSCASVVGMKRRLDVVAGDELVPVMLERQRLIRE